MDIKKGGYKVVEFKSTYIIYAGKNYVISAYDQILSKFPVLFEDSFIDILNSPYACAPKIATF